MTRAANARIAGVMFLLYIAAGLASLFLFGRATSGEGTVARLAGIAQHATDVRISILLSVVMCFAALVLAVTLWALTRDQDREIAMLGLACRVGEGVVGGAFLLGTVGLLWLGTTTPAAVPGADGVTALADFLFKSGRWSTLISATFFAAGSACFAWLLLQGRMIPTPLAWLGVLASILLLVTLPLQLAGFLSRPAFMAAWLPMTVFELVLGPWLIIKGAAASGQGGQGE